MTSIGMNLAGIAYYTGEDPFLDRFKTASAWTAQGTSAPVTLDANGYPTGLPAGATSVYATVGVDPPTAGTSHTYVLTYSGTGTIAPVFGTQIVSSTPGQIVFNTTSYGFFYVMMTADSTTDPIHDIHVVRQDQVSLYNSGEIFNPAFIDKITPFDTLRFMDWEGTNASNLTSWSQRTSVNAATWATGVATGGVPIEVLVKLANETHSNMWYTIPAKADDDYIRNAMQYIKDHLDPGLKVSVEYSNEVWNTSFSQNAYAQSQANQLWGVDANHNGTIDPSEAVAGGANIYYGYRSAQIAAIAHQVFGDESATRLVDVLAGQTGNTYLASNLMATGVARSGLGTIGSLFDAYADTTYFGNQFGSFNPADQAKIYGWATSGAAGLDAAFHELEVGGTLSTDASLTTLLRYWAADATFAHANGLDLVSYEGGADLEYFGFPQAEQAAVSAFFQAIMNDPRMGDLFTKMEQEFASVGGTDMNVLGDVSKITPFGYWGVLDDIYQDGTPRYDALVALAAANHVQETDGTTVAANLVVSTVLHGTASDDTLVGGDGADSIVGLSGSTNALGQMIENDFYFGGGGADTIVGGVGNDHIYGNSPTVVAGAVDGADSLFGGDGNDYIQGNAGADTIDGGNGNDRLYGGADNDSVSGGNGYDYLQGNRGNDTLAGGNGNDTVHGGADDDSLSGNAGDDQLYGDAGNDRLLGGAGHDTLTGGPGNDTFVFTAGDATFSTTGALAFVGDEVTDFVSGTDKISLGFTVGSLLNTASSTQFTSIAAAEHYAQQLLDSHTGAGEVAAVAFGGSTYLFYNGSGTDGAAIDSVVKLDGVTQGHVALADFV